MPICDKCGEDKIEHGFFAHQKFCKGANKDITPKPAIEVTEVTEIEDEEVYIEPIEEDEEPVIVVPEVVIVKSVIEATKEEIKVEVKPAPNHQIEELRRVLGELIEEHNELLNDMSALRSEIKLPDPDVIEKLEVLRNKIDELEEVQEENHEVEDLKESNRKISERIENISLDYSSLKKNVLDAISESGKSKQAMNERMENISVDLNGLRKEICERTQNFSMDHNNLRKEVLDGVSETNKLKTSISEIEELKEKISNLKDCVEFVEDEIETLKDKSEIDNLKADVNELRTKSAQPIFIPGIEELKNDVVELKKVSAKYVKHSENLEQTIPKLTPMPRREMERIKPDQSNGIVKFLVAASIFLSLLWVIL